MLRRKAAQYDILDPQLPALRYKSGQYGELQPQLPALRYKALRYDEVKEQVPAWRSKADRYDRIVSNRLIRFALPLLGLSPAPKSTLLPGHSNSKAGVEPSDAPR